MKVFILLCLCGFAVSGRAQIVIEHTYSETPAQSFGLIQVDSGEWRYIHFNKQDSITIYYLNHSLDRVIHIPWKQGDRETYLGVVAKKLFDLDGKYEYLMASSDTNSWGTLRIVKEDGTQLFFCDSCAPGSGFNQGSSNFFIQVTDSGTKMMISRVQFENKIEVYSLPGKLPGCTTTARSDVSSSHIVMEGTIPSSAYPNPSSNRVRIAYELPSGISHGEIILTSEDGREVKRYRVTNAFSDILLQNSELPSGSYFYTVGTERGASAAKRIVVMR